MSARLAADAQSALAPPELAKLEVPSSIAAIAFDPDDQFGGPALPSDHPAWMKDTVSLSQRARALLTKLKPVVLHVVTYWEHRARSIVIAGRQVLVDASGSYRRD